MSAPAPKNETVEVLSSAKADVAEFCRRLSVVCASLSEAQCRALQDSGVLLALHTTLVALRAGQVGARITPAKVASLVKKLFTELSSD